MSILLYALQLVFQLARWGPQPGPARPRRRPCGRPPRPWPQALLLVLAALPALAARPLVLDDQQPSQSAWPAITVLAEGTAPLSLADVQGLRREFMPPTGPAGNLGTRAEAVWLHLPLQVRQGDGQWVLDIDFPPLNQVDVYLVRPGQATVSHRLGNAMAFDQRPLPTRSHAVALALQPGQAQEVYLRVRSSSALVLPIRLSKPQAFYAREGQEMLLQGLLAGMGLALLMYSLVNWLSLRDPMFLYYAAMMLGIGLLFVCFYGLGHQFLWNAPNALTTKLAPLSVLLAMAAGSQFAALALKAALHQPATLRLLQALAVLACAGFLASIMGLLDLRATVLLATVLGPLPLLAALPLVTSQARQGEPAAIFMLLGWLAYTVGALSMAALLRGHLPVNFWTLHLFQFSAMAEMLLWTQVLSLRVEGIRHQAERAGLERETLLSLAHTDALTGLPNRRGLNLALGQALPTCGPDSVMAIYLLDLDGFKPINDRWGHDAGDALLCLVGDRLRAQLRRGDVVARLGGDEFVIMAPGMGGEAEATALGNKVLQAFRQPFDVQGQACSVGLTIGYALAPFDGRTAADLLKRADAAMYAGKQSGRHCMHRGGASIAMSGT